MPIIASLEVTACAANVMGCFAGGADLRFVHHARGATFAGGGACAFVTTVTSLEWVWVLAGRGVFCYVIA